MKVQFSKSEKKDIVLGEQVETVKEYYYNLIELSQLATQHNEIMDFLFAIKLNYNNLDKAMGDIYSFSDRYFIMVIRQSATKLIKDNCCPDPTNLVTVKILFLINKLIIRINK